MSARTKKILKLAEDSTDHPLLFIPKYESTKGLTDFDRLTACQNWYKLLDCKERRVKKPENGEKSPLPIQNSNNDAEEGNPSLISDIEDTNIESKEKFTESDPLGVTDATQDCIYHMSEGNQNYIAGFQSSSACEVLSNAFQTELHNDICHNTRSKCRFYADLKKTNCVKEDCDEDYNVEDPYQTDGSDDEFIPLSGTSSSSSASSALPNDTNLIEGLNLQTKTNTSNVSVQTSTDDIVCEKVIPKSSRKSYKKNFFCVFCEKLVTRFARHITTLHKNEQQVQDILRYPLKHVTRKILITKLRNKGSLQYNTDKNRNELIVTRRPNPKSKRNAKDFTPCPKCSGYYVSRSFYKHYKKCFMNEDVVAHRERVKSKSECYLLSLNINEMDLHPGVHMLLKDLKIDEVSAIIKNDYLLLHMASFFCQKYLVEKHLNYHSRQKLRQLARLFLTIKSKNPEIIDFQDCLKPINFRKVICGVQDLCSLNVDSGQYKKPAMANHIGTYLKEACDILQSLCIIEQNMKKKQLVIDFKNLLIFEYSAFIGRGARKNIEESKFNRPNTLPSTSDIQVFRDHLITKAEAAYDTLSITYSYSSWKSLMEVVATLILTFNRKRPGEVERILLSSYHARLNITENSEEYKTMSTLEQLLCKSFERMEIRGKLGRRVAVLLRQNYIRYIDTILKYRFEAGVSEQNIYLFGLGDNNHIRLNNVINNEASLSHAVQPELLRATLLRKQVATTSQLLDLNDNEMQLLADFMGHDIEIHKSHYRTPDLTLQIAKLSKFLLAVDGGALNEYKGKSFKNLDIEKFLKNVESNGDYDDDDDDTLDFDDPNRDTTLDYVEQINNVKGISETTSQRNDVAVDPEEKQNFISESKIVRKTWRTPEKYAVREHFKIHLENHTLPTEKDVAQIRKKELRLLKRTPTQIKAWINNENKRKKLNFN